MGWLDADYTSVQFDLNSDGVIDGRDKDLDLPRAAEWTWSLGLMQRLQVGDLGHVDTRVRYSYRDESSFTDNNLGYILSQKILDAGLDFHMGNSRWVFSIYGENLLDDNYQEVFGFGTPGIAGFAGLRIKLGPVAHAPN